MPNRIATFAYGVVSYVIFFGTFLYAIGWVGGFLTPTSVDRGPEAPLAQALAINLGLLGLFAVQHSGMARIGFKRWWTRIIPASIERNTYVLATCVAMWAMYMLWHPLPGTIWSVSTPAARATLHGLYGFGWLVVLCSTFMINHFDLFGLRHAYLNLKGQPIGTLSFRSPLLYKLVRHPIQLGFLIAFWAAPDMSVNRFLFAVGCTGYILVGLYLEERDLVAQYGDTYRAYQRRVFQLLPIPRRAEAQVAAGRVAVR
ncbi:MAG: methanethiol S-methyltransferase [Planctomycetota bacterium]|jgi:protein-S-isoprenylcysteine O-methyltransferase Ste14